MTTGTAPRAIRKPAAGPSTRGYKIASVVLKPSMRAWFRLRLEGAEHLPRKGPAILAANHRSNIDPVLLACAVRRPVLFMAKQELFTPPLGWAMRFIGQFPVKRGGADRQALEGAAAVLRSGTMLGLFPEGSRGTGRFDAVHPGLAYMVLREDCQVLPVALLGTEKLRHRGWLRFRPLIRVIVGPPLELPARSGGKQARRIATEDLRRSLAAFVAEVEPAPGAGSLPSRARHG